MKKYSKFLVQIALVLLFVVPLTMHNVEGAWIYYDKLIDSVTTNIKNITMGKFIYGPVEKPDYENDFNGGTQEDLNNKGAFDTIMGDKQDNGIYPEDETGINNPGSNLSGSLNGLGDVPERGDKPVLSSIDKFVNGVQNDNAGFTNRQDASLGDEVSFLFVKEEEKKGGWFSSSKRSWHIYTTTTPMFASGPSARVNDYLHNAPLFKTGDIIPNVYRAEVKWSTDRNKDGEYTIVKSQKGYCKAAPIQSNPGVPFINSDFTAWSHGSSTGIIEIEGPADHIDHEFLFNDSFKLSVKELKPVGDEYSWSSSRPAFAKVDNNGNVQITNNHLLYDSKSVEIIATSKRDNTIKGGYSFKINLDNYDSNRDTQQGFVINKTDYLVETTGKNVKKGSSGILYTSDSKTQGLSLYYVPKKDKNGNMLPINFTIETYDPLFNLIIHCNNDENIVDNLIKCDTVMTMSDPNNPQNYIRNYSFVPIENNNYYMITIESSNPCRYTF